MLLQPTKWFWVSLATIIVSVLIIFISPPQLGIDFTGGSLIELSGENLDAQALRTALSEELELEAIVQSTQDGSVIIRSVPLSPERHTEVLEATVGTGLAEEELRFESVGPTIGDELRRKALIAIIVAVLAMIAYLAYTFRQTSGLIASWKFGIAAVVALIHDLLVVTAFFSIIGRFTTANIDILFVTATLAILGYSVNDTIVLFNRLKEEWLKARTATLTVVMDKAVKATLTRSLNTSFTTLIVLVALIAFGGSTIRWFVTALAIGTIAGTYSSLFVAPPFLNFLAKRK